MLLLYVYLVALVIGGVLLAASMFLGHHDGDTDVHAEVHVEADAHGDAHVEADGTDHGAAISDLWLPFVNVRFWVFFLCFFGLTGTVFTLLALAGKSATLAAAVMTGAVIGFAAAFVIQRLKRQEVGAGVTEEDFKGMEGVLLLPLPPGGKGKVRLEVKGQMVDVIARCDDPQEIAKGSRVMIIDFKNNEAVVVTAGEVESRGQNGG
jgi:membrane protein implicated in regulation of membrane protease activity